MTAPIKISVIVITYNRLPALECLLSGLRRQTDARFEVIVGDDGSSPPAGDLVDTCRDRFGPTRLEYVYQEDTGFRAAEIRNKCVVHASGDFLVFLDGDCVPRPDFVAGYRQAARAGEYLFGRRVLVNRSLTAAVEAEQLPIETWTLSRLLRCRLRGEINSVVKCFVGEGRLARAKHHAWRRLRSCNFGVWRSDFAAVNGFDEAYQGWGYEDSDLTIRLLNHGLHLLPAPAASTVFHLWHDERQREFAGRNWERLDAVMRSERTWAEVGLDRHPAAIPSSTVGQRKAG